MLEIIDKEDVRKCFKCGNEKTFVDHSGRQHWSYHYGEKGERTGEWLCNTCRMNTESTKKYYKDRYEELKHVTDCRNAYININRDKCKGCIGVQICAITLGVNILDIEMDNFRYFVDLSAHQEYGYGEVKTATLNVREGRWYFSKIHKENFDTLILVCMDQYEHWKDVMRIYIIPTHKITTTTTITIYLSSSRITWYENFEIDVKPYNNTYHNMDIERCPALRKYKKSMDC